MRHKRSEQARIPDVDAWLEALQPGSPALLTTTELAARWRMSARSFERWRAKGKGPAWLRLEGRILYRLQDVVAWEAAQVQGSED